MKKPILSLGLLALLLAISGCGMFPSSKTSESPTPSAPETISEAKASIEADSSSTTPSAVNATPSQAPTSSRTKVIWEDYDSGLRIEIDRMTSASDCLGINSYFGMATATEESVKARTGHGNDALTSYLNESLALANCN
ncbi:hypothetical protein M2113_001537 [Aurantimicrobium minutum]|uniref:hypothetical protein n=1 Tax=Aurantimicrobium minutum TaxID=708131 RepID=UPI002475CC38|nr:hypothetical protein [Aurantimicrobium minutum]MDH6410547.1 hypothetical protein [Aurantimicrobium minutum]